MPFASFQQAYVHLLDETYRAPTFVNAPRGFASRERLGLAFELTQPRARLCHLHSRRTNIVFCFAEALWYLRGEPDLATIAYYAPMIRRYSADGCVLQGTAYGPRIFRFGSGIDQWQRVAEQIAADPDSKRAVIQIFDPSELAIEGNIDVACTLALQFLAREGALHLVAHMRANDVFRGLCSDLFSFTVLQEFMACRLGLRLGSYFHAVGSYHVYASDFAAVEAVLSEADAAVGNEPHGDLACTPMPDGDNRPALAEVLAIEEALREDRLALRADALAALGLPAFWREIVGLLELYREILAGSPADPEITAMLPPAYRRLMAGRWPAAFGSSMEAGRAAA